MLLTMMMMTLRSTVGMRIAPQRYSIRAAYATAAATSQTTLQLNLPNGRFYQLGKDRLPSVTTVLSIINKEELQKWERRLVTNALCEELPKDVFSLVSQELSREQDDVFDNEDHIRTSLRERLQVNIRRLVLEAWKAPERIRTQASDLGTTTHSRTLFLSFLLCVYS